MGNAVPVCQTQCASDHACDAALKDCIQELPLGRPEAPTLEQKLLAASRDGDLTTVQSCLAEGADVNSRQPLKLITLDRYQTGQPVKNCGMTPLMLASRNGHSRCVDVLIKAGSRINDYDEEGVTALHLAAASGEL